MCRQCMMLILTVQSCHVCSCHDLMLLLIKMHVPALLWKAMLEVDSFMLSLFAF